MLYITYNNNNNLIQINGSTGENNVLVGSKIKIRDPTKT